MEGCRLGSLGERPDAADYVAIIEFDDPDGLEAYLRHPAHAELGARFGQSLSSATGYDVEVGGIEALRAGGFLQSEETHHPVHDAWLVACLRIELGQDVEALGDALDDADAEPARGGGQLCFVLTPDQDRARFRVDDHVEAVLRAIVDDDVEAERGGDAASRSRAARLIQGGPNWSVCCSSKIEY